VALWRISLAVAALTFSGCGGQTAVPSGSHTGTSRTGTAPKLVPVQQQPFVVQGSGFRPGEHVRVTMKTRPPQTVETVAGDTGTFRVTFRHQPCGSIDVQAQGSKGSTAEFNLSQIACAGT
jgi:hypothetical protein